MNTRPAADRAVPVFVEQGARRRVAGATDWWFYPLILALAAGLVALSLGAGAFPTRPAPQAAAVQSGVLVYGPHALARGVEASPDSVIHVVRDFGVSARALRIAVKPATPAPAAEAATGVRLLLTPADAALLAGREVEVELQVRRFNVTAAGGVAVSLQNGGPVTWTTIPLPPASGPVTVRVTAPEGAPPEALGLRMLSDHTDFNYGAEIAQVRLRPAG